MALYFEDKRQMAVQVPAGSIVIVEAGTLRADQLVNVQWAGKQVRMFTQDLRLRCEKVD
jgi:hypothetical protein